MVRRFKKIIFLLFVFFAAQTAAAFGSGAGDTISILFVKSERDLDAAAASTIRLMRHNFDQYSSIDPQIRTRTVDQEFFSSYHNKAERVIRDLVVNHSCDYLVFMRIVDDQYCCFELWSKDMVMENIYIPFNESLEIVMPDIAANAFLSLLYNMEDQLWEARLY